MEEESLKEFIKELQERIIELENRLEEIYYFVIERKI